MYIREWILGNKKPAPKRTLKLLSQRFDEATEALGLRRLHCMFDEKHGIITSAHYRAFAEVVEVITCDVVPPASPLGVAIQTTVEWYWSCRAQRFTQRDLDRLERLTREMQDAWEVLDSQEWRATLREGKKDIAKNGVLNTTKMHRATSHMVDYIKRWGPVEYLTTETSEALHKPLKIIFRMYVLLPLRAVALLLLLCL